MLSEYADTADACAKEIPEWLAGVYRELSELRNDINHGGFVYARAAADLRAGLERCHEAVMQGLGLLLAPHAYAAKSWATRESAASYPSQPLVDAAELAVDSARGWLRLLKLHE